MAIFCPAGTMSTTSGVWIWFLQLLFLSHIAAIDFSIDRSTDGQYCGTLQCLARFQPDDPRVFAISSLAILELTLTNTTRKLVSVTPFGAELDIDENWRGRIDFHGSASRYDANLTLSLKNAIDCLQTSFVCELDYFNTTGQTETTRQYVPSVSGGELPLILSLLEKLVGQVKSLSDYFYLKQSALETQIDNLKTQSNAKLDRILQQLSVPEVENNTARNETISLAQCVQGMKHDADRVKVTLWNQIVALCDTTTDGGGWVIIQRRTKGDVDFYRDWDSYKNGFGTPDTDYWIGNDVIHNLTTQMYNEFRMDMIINGTGKYLHTDQFRVANELLMYQLSLGSVNGNTNDVMSTHNTRTFSTFDLFENLIGSNCATLNHGAWWYSSCFGANLNGMWGIKNNTGMAVFFDSYEYVDSSEVKIRQK